MRGYVAGAWRDLRRAVRQLRRSPAFTATAVVTLALGIGATTAIFTLLQQVMLRSLPVARPDQLWRVGRGVRCCYTARYSQNDWSLFSWEAYRLFRADTPGFEDLAAFQIGAGNAELAVRRAGSPEPAETRIGEYVSGNFFTTLGISAWRGRLFSDADDHESAPPAAVMSFHTWREKYGLDPSVIGASYQLNGHSFTIVGVTQPGFFGAKIAGSDMPDLWLPLATEPLIAGGTSRLRNPRLAWLDVLGRIRPGTNPKSVEAAPGGVAPVAGEPSGGYDAAGKGTLGPADPPSDTWRRGCFPDAGILPERFAAAHARRFLCPAGGLRQHRQGDVDSFILLKIKRRVA